MTVTVRLAPDPPKTMFAVGTSVVFDELPETVRLPAAVSWSPTVKASALVAPPSIVKVAVIDVPLTTVTLLTATPAALTATVAPDTKSVPLSVTVTVLPGAPAAGVTLVRVGAGGGTGDTFSDAVRVSPPAVPVIVTSCEAPTFCVVTENVPLVSPPPIVIAGQARLVRPR